METHKLWTCTEQGWKEFYFYSSGVPSRRKQPSAKMREHLFREQDGKCKYCKKSMTQSPNDFDCDHIIPVRVGGPTCLSNLHLLCVRCHREKSARERRSHAMADRHVQANETVDITPKSIPAVVDWTDGDVHISEQPDTGVQYSISYELSDTVTPTEIEDSQSRQRTLMLTSTIAHRKRPAEGDDIGASKLRKASVHTRTIVHRRQPSKRNDMRESATKLTVTFDSRSAVDVGAIHKCVSALYQVGYVGLYQCDDHKAVYIQTADKKIRMASEKLRKNFRHLGAIGHVRRYEQREGSIISEVGVFRNRGRQAEAGQACLTEETCSSKEIEQKTSTPASTGVGKRLINLYINTFGEEDLSHISLEQLKEAINSREKNIDVAEHLTIPHKIGSLVFENPHNSNVIASTKSGDIKYFNGNTWVKIGNDEIGIIVNNWILKARQLFHIMEKHVGEQFTKSHEGRCVSELVDLPDEWHHVRTLEQKKCRKFVKKRALICIENMNLKLKGVESTTGRRVKRVSGYESGLREGDTVSQATWEQLLST